MTQSAHPSTSEVAAPAAADHRSHSFETPEHVSVSVDIGAGAVHVTATDRRDTVVVVLPSRPDRSTDRAAAEQTTVERTGDLIAVKAPRRWARHILGPGESLVDVHIALPTGSALRVDAGAGTVLCSGRIGESEITTGFGDVQVDEVGSLRLRTGAGDLSVEMATGRVEAKTGTGSVRISSVDGPAVVRNSNGDTWIGEVSGDLEVRAANGRIAVDRAGGAVTARTANGAVLLGEVARGAIVANTAAGRIELGVRAGVAAWLDLNTRFGNVHNDLESTEPPAPGEDSVEIHATTSFGDITVRRSQP